MPQSPKRPRMMWGLILAITFLYAFMLGSRPFASPDEGRYVEIPREMVVSGDYVTPRLNGVKYFEKPPLFYWLQALSLKIGGVQEWAARFWVAAFALLGCWMIYAIGRLLFSPASGLWGALILATCPLYFGLGHLVVLDLPVSIWMNSSLFCFLAQYCSSPQRSRTLRLMAFACAGLGVMTKGLMAIILPWGVLGLWILTTQRYRRLKDLFCPWGWLVFLAITAPWHILVSLKNPEFPWFYFIHEHVLRYTTKVHGRYQPMWFFIPVLFLGMAPWSTFLLPLLGRLKQWWADEAQRLLVLWSGLIFIFFSFSHSKLGPYILPILPTLSLWIGHHVAQALEQPDAHLLRTTFPLRLILGVVLIGTLIYFMRKDTSFHTPKHFTILALMGLTWLGGLALEGFFGLRRHLWKRALGAVAASTAVFLMLTHTVAEDIQKLSIKPIAHLLRTHLHPGDAVVIYGTYYQDLPPYLERTVGVVNWQGELSFGISVEDQTRTWMMDEATFWKLWNGDQKVFVVVPQSLYLQHFQKPGLAHTVLAETERDIVLSNR